MFRVARSFTLLPLVTIIIKSYIIYFNITGALQLQINIQNDQPQPDSGIDTSSLDNGGDDDIDAALSELQVTLEGSRNGTKSGDITHIPELTDYLRFFK